MKKKINFSNELKPNPYQLKPMLAVLGETPPSKGDWIYEIKFDGFRALSFCHTSKVEIFSRNNKSFNEKFYPIVEALKKLQLNGVLDGEIVVINEKGAASFSSLQDWRSEADGELIYYVFDILWFKRNNLTKVPLLKRKELLKKILPKQGIIKISDYFTENAEQILLEAKNNKLEGIIAKRSDSFYYPGLRSSEWVKIKAQIRHEVVIGGYTKNEDTPKLFSSLLVGVFENKGLEYIGKIGTGFNKTSQQNLIKRFKKLITKHCPFTFVPDINKPSRFNPHPPKAKAIWLKPKLVCEVSYTEMTKEGIIRHPSFKGMRDDKIAQEVHAEIPTKQNKKRNLIIKLESPRKRERKTLLNPKEDTQVKLINNQELKFNHLNKIFWPKDGYTKRDLLNYYYQIAPYILPYLLNRPQTLNRFPNGIEGLSFYQKDVTKTAPSWIKKYPYRTSLGEDKNYIVVQSELDLFWMVNLGVIEINPWSSTIEKIDYPTWCMIDIDPSAANSFEQVIETARVTKQILDELNVKSYCKTSGASGLHIYMPVNNKYSYAECQLFARIIATEVNKRFPKITSIERYSIKRPNKIYVDFLQNRPKATVAAPYSVRPKPDATISMPLHWDEITKKLKPIKFTIKNALERLQSEGDLFKPVLGKGINLDKILKLLKNLE